MRNKLRELRTSQNLSITAFSKKLNIPWISYSQIENGKMYGTMDTWLKLAKYYGWDLKTLEKYYKEV